MCWSWFVFGFVKKSINCNWIVNIGSLKSNSTLSPFLLCSNCHWTNSELRTSISPSICPPRHESCGCDNFLHSIHHFALMMMMINASLAIELGYWVWIKVRDEAEAGRVCFYLFFLNAFPIATLIVRRLAEKSYS